MKIAISGATGFIGTHLSGYLTDKGHRIVPLKRELFNREHFSQLRDIISSSDTVINLAGAPINRRWTQAYKQILLESRLSTTASLVDAINTSPTPPRLFISASASGYYPSTGCYDEYDTPQTTGFLSELCRQWEAEARKVIPEVRLAITRFGIVLSPDGGAFKQLKQITKIKLATIIGPGSQPFTWIDLQDLLRAMAMIIESPNLSGTFNLVAPQKITNAQFTRELAHSTHTLLTLKIPSPFFRLLYGEGATFLTQGQCISPKRLVEAGFQFHSDNIQEFLAKERKSEK